MTTARPRRSFMAAFGGVLILLCVLILSPTGGSTTTTEAPRLPEPEDRYALAGGCYGLRSLATGLYVARNGSGFSASAALADAEPFFFKATDLGSYLLFGSTQDFLAGSEGGAGELMNSLVNSPAGGVVSGLTSGITDAVADAVTEGPLGRATGRGESVVAAPVPDELADWDVDAHEGAFRVLLPATNQLLAVDQNGALLLQDIPPTDESILFHFHVTNGCAAFPEIEINVDGPVATGTTPFTEVQGFLDAHVHMMAFEFIGGAVRCGTPWDRFGVTKALVDCPDHVIAGGRGAALEMILSGGTPIEGHDPHGWPTFVGWPRYNSLTHEQLYYRWLERAWRGGLRLFTNLLVDNHALCTVYPLHKHGCNEMDGVRLQAQRLRELERYIDAQSGGPGEGWFRIVTDPFQARRVINAGKLAVIMGIEVSLPLDCGIVLDIPQCDEGQIDAGFDEVYDLGVRQMEIANKFDNALTGITGDGGTTGIIVNGGNKLETGEYWQMESCREEDDGAHDRPQLNVHDDAGTPDALTGRDSIFAGVLQVTGTSGVAPLYPPGPHCNVLGLTSLGEHAVRKMISKGMIFDPDHMSARARHQALDILAAEGYSGVVSSHSWSDDTVYPRVYQLGGVVTPYAGGSQGFVETWRQHRPWADPRFTFGFGYGSDVNGFGSQGSPRGAGSSPRVTYPFTGFGGVTVHQQRSGERTYDINTDGVAHYGLYPDWLEDLRLLGGQAIIDDMLRGPEAYLQMWERAIGVAPDACRADVADLADASITGLTVGMTPEQVLGAIGQPHERNGTEYRYCAAGGTGTVTFSADGHLTGTAIG